MSVRAQRVLLLEAFSSKEDPDRTASEHDTGPLPPFVTTANPTERARETYAYAEEIVLELPSNSVEEMEANVARLAQWVSSWRPPAET